MANDEDIIIERIKGGHNKEFGQLVKRYGPQLMQFVGRIVGVQEDTEDVVQNTFVAAFLHLKDYDPQKASLQTWLQRIAYHETLYHLRKRKRQVVLPLHADKDIPDDLPEDTTAQQLDEAIQQLSPEEQTLLQLFYYDGRSLKEIAYITDKAGQATTREVSRLSSQLFRIRQRLRIILTHMKP